MKWSEMAPRQRDAALAKRQGWIDFEESFGFWYGRPPEYEGSRLPIPFYTVYSAAALELAEWMAAQGYWVKAIHRGANHAAQHKYYCYIEKRVKDETDANDDERLGVYANGDSYAEAVSEAVWLALGGE